MMDTLHSSLDIILCMYLQSRLQTTEMRVLRKIAGVTRLDQVRNDTVRDRLRLEPVLKKVEMRKEC